MSLVCHECGDDLVPGEALPGREGGMIQPTLLSLAWLPNGTGWRPVFVEAPNQISICFQCVMKGIPMERRPELKTVFVARDAEVAWRRNEEVIHGTWVGGEELDRQLQLREALSEKLKLISVDTCLCCGNGITAKIKAFFIFKAMDRVYGEQRRSLFGAYQWSHIKTGEVHFPICFSCCQTYLPRTFEQLSHYLLGTGQSTLAGAGTVELYLSPEILALLGLGTGDPVN